MKCFFVLPLPHPYQKELTFTGDGQQDTLLILPRATLLLLPSVIIYSKGTDLWAYPTEHHQPTLPL